MSKIRTVEELREGGVTLLGNQNNKYSFDYNPDVLETFVNKHPNNDYWVKFNAVEFTSLCPITEQPDFGKVYINYIPNEKMVESKALKLYLFSFRNHGDYHEDCCNIILNDLYNLMQPKYIEVQMKFLPRGGISIFPFTSRCNGDEKYQKLLDYRFSNHDLSFENIDNL